MKSFSTYFIIEWQIKITMGNHTHIRMAKIRNTDNTKCWWGFGSPFIACGKLKWYSHWTQCKSFLQNPTYSYHMIQQSHSLVFIKNSWKLMVYPETCIWMFIHSFIHNHQNLKATKRKRKINCSTLRQWNINQH